MNKNVRKKAKKKKWEKWREKEILRRRKQWTNHEKQGKMKTETWQQ